MRLPQRIAVLVLACAPMWLTPSAAIAVTSPSRLSHPGPGGEPTIAATPLFVTWGGSSWPATVVETYRDGTALIHYEGYSESWDERVGPGRMQREVDRGKLHVEWQGSWWPATVLRQQRGGAALIRYDGYGPEWDEVVPASRMKLLAPIPP